MYVFILFMLVCGYYTMTYGLSLWREDDNKLGALAAIVMAVIGVVLPSIVLILKG